MRLKTPVPPALDGANQFSLQIGGSWDPTTGTVGTPAPSGGLSSPIWFFNVTRISQNKRWVIMAQIAGENGVLAAIDKVLLKPWIEID